MSHLRGSLAQCGLQDCHFLGCNDGSLSNLNIRMLQFSLPELEAPIELIGWDSQNKSRFLFGWHITHTFEHIALFSNDIYADH